MDNHSDKVSFIWSVADLIRDTFKRSKYQDVILPLTVLRRIDCVLQPTKPRVLEDLQQLSRGNLIISRRNCAGPPATPFITPRRMTLSVCCKMRPTLATNLRAYINGFSDNMREVLEKFDFNNTINKLDEAGLLFLVMEKFKNIDLHPDKVSNLRDGLYF